MPSVDIVILTSHRIKMKFLVLACIVLALGAVDSKKDGCSGAKKCRKARLCDQLGCDSDLENCEMFTVGAKTFAKCVPKSESRSTHVIPIKCIHVHVQHFLFYLYLSCTCMHRLLSNL